MRSQTQYVMKEIDLVQFGPKGRKDALKEVGFLNAMHHPFIVAYREFFEQDPSGVRQQTADESHTHVACYVRQTKGNLMNPPSPQVSPQSTLLRVDIHRT
jgi:hypothetical protein